MIIPYAFLFLLGCCSIYCFRSMPNLWIPVVVLITAGLFHLQFRKRVTELSFIFMLGCCYVLFVSYHHLHHALPKADETKDLMVVGRIISLPEQKIPSTEFLFKISTIDEIPIHLTARLSWYGHVPNLQAGEIWRLHVRVKRPRGYSNPGGFDYEAWLFLNDIGATGFVINSPENKKIASVSVMYDIDHWRMEMLAHLKQLFPHEAALSFLTALMLGDRGLLTTEQWKVLQVTGTEHLIAIAGLHIGLIDGFVYCFINFLWRRSRHFMLYVPAQIAASSGGFMAALFYSMLAGFPLQTKRALIMLAAGLIGVLCRRRFLSWQSFSLALLWVLFLNPLDVLSESFWLSFATVAWIILALNHRPIGEGWRRYIYLQWTITLGLLPLTLIFFSQISCLGFFANLIVVPWFALIIMPCCFLGDLFLMTLPVIAKILLLFVLLNIKVMFAFLSYLSNFSALIWQPAFPTPLIFCLTLMGVFLLLTTQKNWIRGLSIVCFLPLIFSRAPSPQLGEWWVTLLDVGQGLSTVIQTAHHVLIYDTGPRFGPEQDAAQFVIIPFLNRQGIHHIDRIIVSHGDEDHSGGANTLLKTMHVDSLMTSDTDLFKSTYPGVAPCEENTHWRWDGVDFQFLSPPAGLPYQDNNSSCVLKIYDGHHSVLFTGDIEASLESDLIHRERTQLPSEILVAPHHGSKTSSSPDFVAAVQPRYVLYPVGYLNRFHFPHPSVVQRYQSVLAKQFDTATDGAITFKIDPNHDEMALTLYRLTDQSIWRSH
ncbi:MAG: DNA internalization-related competence protein ComEC/Rec2 [Gammaproteobacteria bacterium GWE2_42_36]|nr:MAG: DNA internalization-related competence protein ComEC/Rec2 [Gammaproteobacteria bacterium GWE2_42_36]HCU05676.1 DNA internalization-related competence protein ComEC/Rec2 [Coxiellaceae bacterium]